MKRKNCVCVVGIGGCGNVLLDKLYACGEQPNVKYIAFNTDEQALEKTIVPNTLHIGSNPNGTGAGGSVEAGEVAAQESAHKIKKAIKGCSAVVILAGMGRGTGTGASPVVARIAHRMNIPVHSVVTYPFKFEGKLRIQRAEAGAKELSRFSAVTVVPNEAFPAVLGSKVPLEELFELTNTAILYTTTAVIHALHQAKKRGWLKRLLNRNREI